MAGCLGPVTADSLSGAGFGRRSVPLPSAGLRPRGFFTLGPDTADPLRPRSRSGLDEAADRFVFDDDDDDDDLGFGLNFWRLGHVSANFDGLVTRRSQVVAGGDVGEGLRANVCLMGGR